MWNDIVYGKGGLALHAGLKVIPTADGDKVFMIIGLSGTGKTTTTFTTQNGSRPIQDDFVGLMPGGHAFGTENGCFAKTFGLDPDFEPSIHGAVVKPTTYLENVYQEDDGTVDFFNEHYTKNGRAVFEMQDLLSFEDARNVGPVDYLLILNRNENIIPAVAKLNLEQAAAFFMLGETTGTAAGGAAEEGKFLRVPGHEPVLPAAARAAGQPAPRAARHPSDRDVPAEHRAGRGQGRRRPLEEAADPRHVGVREGHRRAVDRVRRGSRTSATRWRRRCPSSTTRRSSSRAASTSAGPRGRVPRDRRAAEERARDAPAAVHAAVRGHHQGRRLTPIVTTREAGARPRPPAFLTGPRLARPEEPRREQLHRAEREEHDDQPRELTRVVGVGAPHRVDRAEQHEHPRGERTRCRRGRSTNARTGARRSGRSRPPDGGTSRRRTARRARRTRPRTPTRRDRSRRRRRRARPRSSGGLPKQRADLVVGHLVEVGVALPHRPEAARRRHRHDLIERVGATRPSTPAGATGTAKIARTAPAPFAHRPAARAVTPVATPSSTTTADAAPDVPRRAGHRGSGPPGDLRLDPCRSRARAIAGVIPRLAITVGFEHTDARAPRRRSRAPGCRGAPSFFGTTTSSGSPSARRDAARRRRRRRGGCRARRPGPRGCRRSTSAS